MTKKPRENRVPIMMSDEELNSIDDWRFENRVATRSDAVRKLVQLGLLLDAHVEDIGRGTMDVFSTTLTRLVALTPPKDQEAEDDPNQASRSELSKIFPVIRDLQYVVQEMTFPAAELRKEGRLDDVISRSREELERMQRWGREARQRGWEGPEK